MIFFQISMTFSGDFLSLTGAVKKQTTKWRQFLPSYFDSGKHEGPVCVHCSPEICCDTVYDSAAAMFCARFEQN